jgi:hypothetical protein
VNEPIVPAVLRLCSPGSTFGGEEIFLSKLLIGLYSYSSGLNYGQTAALLLGVLRKQVGRCRSELASLSDRRKGTVQAIFVAPEYLFTA